MIDRELKTVNVWWPKMPTPGNFGDILTPYLIKKMTGYTCNYSPNPFQVPTLLGIGSIISKTSKLTTVWGSGTISTSSKAHPESVYLAVRGPLTRDLIIEQGGICPDIFGDPALILPKILNISPNPKYELGIIPHYVDYEHARKWYAKDRRVKIINLLNADPTIPVREMMQCKTVVSSSLHGLIVANAYGIPAAWVKFSDKLAGDGIKFQDYFESVRVKHSCTVINGFVSVQDLMKIPTIKEINIDINPLLKVFPI